MTDVSCSAVLIARNEETTIDACLQSVRGLVDEIVVLDTGSSDQTRDRARNAGARVIDAQWRDDFSAARNEASTHARGRWIFSIDADERVVRGSRQDLIPLLTDSSRLAYRAWLQPDSGCTPYRQYRLYRNHPDIRFDGRIRESIVPSIRRLADREAGGALSGGSVFDALVGDCETWIAHQDAPATRRRKHERDLPLLQRAIQDEGDNALYWTDLGRALAALGDSGAAMDAWQRAIELVRRAGGRSLADSLPYTDVLQRSGVSDGQREALLDEASARFPQSQLLVWLRAETLVAERRFAEAEPLLRRLAAMDIERDACPTLAYDRRIFNEFAYAALATCCFGVGRWAEAAHWYGRAATAQPERVEYPRQARAVTQASGARPQILRSS